MTYTVSDNVPWLTVSPASETSTGPHNQHTISYDASALAVGTYDAIINIDCIGAVSSSTNVPVTLRVFGGNSFLAEAVDFTNATWITGGDAPWHLVTSPSQDGLDSAQSGAITDNQSNWVEAAIQGPGTLSFWTKISSESGFDFLDLLLDGAYLGVRFSGDLDWQQTFIDIPSGTHTVRWLYSKDLNTAWGQDAAWLDQVTFTPGASGIDTVLFENFSTGSLPAGWTVIDSVGNGDQWAFNDPGGEGNFTAGTGNFAIADCSIAYQAMDTELRTPLLNLSAYTNAILEFKTDFYVFGFREAKASIDLSLNGAAWSTIWFRTNDLNGTVTLSLPQGAGCPNVQLRFRYQADLDFWWAIDDVKITAQNVSTIPASGMVAQWRQAWEDFDRNYSCFALKNIDWAPVYDASTNAFAQINTPGAFAVELANVLRALPDWEITVAGQMPYFAMLQTNFSAMFFFTNYTGGTPYQDVEGLHALYHAWVSNDLACIIVSNLHSSVFTNITDADLNALFQTYENAKGLILDLRPAAGGDMTNAERLASHFTDLPRTYGYTRTRIPGSDHSAFTPYSPRILNPSAGPLFTNYTVCLIGQITMGSAEWLALMMKSCPQMTLMGDHTRGATGNALEFAQTNIGVSYTIPRWVGYTADLVTFENVGIAPQIAMDPAASFSNGDYRDYLLEHAILWLRRPQLTLTTLAPNQIVVSWPGQDGYSYTLLRNTNPPAASWTLAPGWTSNRAGIAPLMHYTNSQPQTFETYRLQLR